jgi:hypothetical protein
MASQGRRKQQRGRLMRLGHSRRHVHTLGRGRNACSVGLPVSGSAGFCFGAVVDPYRTRAGTASEVTPKLRDFSEPSSLPSRATRAPLGQVGSPYEPPWPRRALVCVEAADEVGLPLTSSRRPPLLEQAGSVEQLSAQDDRLYVLDIRNRVERVSLDGNEIRGSPARSAFGSGTSFIQSTPFATF